MKKIRSQEEIERDRKRNAWIIGIVMIFLMLFSTLGYALLSGGNLGGNNPNLEDPNLGGNYIIFQKEGRQFYFLTPKLVAEEIPVDIDLTLNDYLGERVYLVSEENRGWSEISLNLGQVVGSLQEACYGPCEKDLPEKQCDEKLIIWSDSQENRVYQEQECIFIEGDNKAVDAFLYKLIGI